MEDETSQHLDPTSEITLETVKKRAVRGVVILTGRTFLLSTLSLLAVGFLGTFLGIEEFGIFGVVSAVVNFLVYFSDIGLAASLIQKKGKVTPSDLKTTFTVQQILVLALLVILYFAAPAINSFYDLSREGMYLLYALGVSFFLSSLKTIPSAILERKLQFDKLIIPQILENIVYNLTVVYLAWQGYGIMSFTYAVLARGVIGLIAIYIVQPWMPGLAFSKSTLKKLLKFGVPYQVNTLLAVVKDDGLTVVLGGILGLGPMGLLIWAQKWGQAPLRFFMDHVIKVTFPAFSRMQNKKAALESAVTRSIFFICFLVFPAIAGLLIVAPILVRVIPRYEQWIPALIPLSLIAINTSFAAVTTQLTNLFNATGKIKTTFKLMVMWTLLTWISVPYLAGRFGVNGAALGYALVGSSSVIAIYIAKRVFRFSLVNAVFRPALATAVMAALLIIVRGALPIRMMTVWALILLGLVSYLGLSYVIVGSTLLGDARKSLSLLAGKRKNG